jgi:hypothetical protein
LPPGIGVILLLCMISCPLHSRERRSAPSASMTRPSKRNSQQISKRGPRTMPLAHSS